MNVLFIAPYVPSPIRVRPYHFVRELSRHHNVTVLAVGSAADAGAARELARICRAVEIVPVALPHNAGDLARAVVRGDPLQSAVCHSPYLRQRLDEILEAQAFDIVHVEHLRAARLLSQFPEDVPTLFDSVDSISLLLERTLRASHSPRQRLIALIELERTRRYEARLVQAFDRVVVTSSDDAAHLRKLHSVANLYVVPNGVDATTFRPHLTPPDPATLVFSGKMSYHANVSAVLHFVRHILPVVRVHRPDVRLRIVGSEPPASIRALTRDPAIAVTGAVSDMRAALRGATLAVCPVTVKVGIQNKVLEAMALGLPVVCSALGAQGIDARAGEDFLVARNPSEFAHSILRILSDHDLRAHVGSSGRAYVEAHHRWDDAAAHLADLYTGLVEDRRRARAA